MSRLRRELGLFDATVLGLGSILGTGVFVSLGLAAGVAGVWVVPAVAVAAVVATCNALSTAQLAAAYPTSGGSYEYGYRLLHPLAGFTAGWTFLCAKSASAAAAALGFGGYVSGLLGWSGAGAQVGLGLAAVALFTILAAGGIRRSARANTVIVTVTVVALAGFVAGGAASAATGWSRIPIGVPEAPALFEAVALCFVAYTGYGRVATLAEEVADPRRTIPRAIVSTLVVTAAIYASVTVVGVGAVGGEGLYRATAVQAAPLEVVAREFGVPGLPHLVAVGAVTAMLGVLLNLILGLSRVLLAMGRRGDMPSAVTVIHAERSVPTVAVYAVGAVIVGLTLTGRIAVVWSFSAFTVLVYYAIANLAALRLPASERLFPRAWSVGGLASCVFLAFWVDFPVWMAGVAVIAVGVVWHTVARRAGGPSPRGGAGAA